MRVAGDDAEADAAEEGDAGVGPPAVPVFLAELEVFLSYILIIFYALQSGGGTDGSFCFVAPGGFKRRSDPTIGCRDIDFYLHQLGGKITTPLFCAGGFLVERR